MLFLLLSFLLWFVTHKSQGMNQQELNVKFDTYYTYRKFTTKFSIWKILTSKIALQWEHFFHPNAKIYQ